MLLFNDYKSAKNWLNHLVSYLLLIAVISILFCVGFLCHDWYIRLTIAGKDR